MINTSVELLGAAAPSISECTQEMKPLGLAGVGSMVGSAGAGLYGTYKLFKGKPAAGVTGFVAAVGFWFIGCKLINAAGRKFQQCAGMTIQQALQQQQQQYQQQQQRP